MKRFILFLAVALSLNSYAQQRTLGWKSNPRHAKGLKQLPMMAAPLPPSANLQGAMPPVYDQGALGSCTAQAGCGAFDYQYRRQNSTFAFPSRLDLYQNELKHDGTWPNDNGSYTSSILWVLTKQGVCLEKDWIYNPAKLAMNPPACATKRRPEYMAVTVFDVPNDASGYGVKSCIALKKLPVLTGGYVFENIFTPLKDKVTGQWYVPMPKGKPVGGHEILIVGFDDNLTIAGIKGWVRVRNSWGSSWADSGYAWFPQAYLLNPKYFEDNGAIQVTTTKKP